MFHSSPIKSATNKPTTVDVIATPRMVFRSIGGLMLSDHHQNPRKASAAMMNSNLSSNIPSMNPAPAATHCADAPS